MRALPGVTVLAPSTSKEAEASVYSLYHHTGVGYIRLDKSEFMPDQLFDFSVGKSNELRSGTDITLVAIGGVVKEAMEAANALSNKKIECRVLSLYSIKPIDADAIKRACAETGGIVTIEEGNLSGGVGSAISELCMDCGFEPKSFKRIGLKDHYSEIVGSQEYLRSVYKIDKEEIINTVLRSL